MRSSLPRQAPIVLRSMFMSMLLCCSCEHRGNYPRHDDSKVKWLVLQFSKQAPGAHGGILVRYNGGDLEIDHVLQNGVFFNTPKGLDELVEARRKSAGPVGCYDGMAFLSSSASTSGIFESYALSLPGSQNYRTPTGEAKPRQGESWVSFDLRLLRGQHTGRAGILVPRDPLSSSGNTRPGWEFHYGDFVKDIHALDRGYVLSTIVPMGYSQLDDSKPTRGLTSNEAAEFNSSYRRQLEWLTEEQN